MFDVIRSLFPFFLVLMAYSVLLLLLGLVLHASGYFIVGRYLVAMSGLCGKWLVRTCPYEVGDFCPLWNCPRATDRKDPCPVVQAQVAAGRKKRAEKKAARMALKRPQE